MNKWQKVTNQIAKDTDYFMAISFRERRVIHREAIKKYIESFKELVQFKNWRKNNE